MPRARRRRRHLRLRKGKLIALVALVSVLVVPFGVEILTPEQYISNPSTNLIGWLGQNFGFYYLEAISLSLVSLF